MGTRDERDGMEAAHRSSNLFHFAAQTPLSGITANGIFYIEHSLTQQHRRSAKSASYAPRGLLTHYHTTDKLNLVLIFIELLVHNVTPIREALPPPPKKKKGGWGQVVQNFYRSLFMAYFTPFLPKKIGKFTIK